MAGMDDIVERTNPTEIFSFDSMIRLATFRQVVHYETPMCLSSLAESGFIFAGYGSSIKCVGCQRSVDLFGVRTDPSDKCYHTGMCPFATSGNQSSDEGYEGESDLQVDGLVASPPVAPICPEVVNSLELPPTNELKSVDPLSSDLRHHTSSPYRSFEHSVNETGNDATGIQPNQTTLPPSLLGATSSIIETTETTETSRETASPSSGLSDYSSDSSDNYFFDSDAFKPECHYTRKNPDPVHRVHCDKNPGHYAYFPASSINLQQIPSSTRHPDVIKILQLCSELTVKISVCHISRHRPKEDEVLRSTLTPRFGTGFMQDDTGEVSNTDGSLKKFVPFLSKNKKHEIYIRTNRHLVFDGTEAEKSTVEFTYKHNNNVKIITLKGKGVLYSKTPANNSVILVCTSSDQDFVKRISTARNQILELTANLPRRIKVGLTKKLFIIHHPHGGEMVISYGDSVMVKYLLEETGHGRQRLSKINGQLHLEQHLSQNRVRKALLYAADTCSGSSGAPILTFRRDASVVGAQEFVLEIWMHNGVDNGSNLGGSVMKEYRLVDYELANRVGQSSSSSQENQDDDDDDDDSTEDKHVTSPVFKVLSRASYPVYIPYHKRLESFNDWIFQEIHDPKVLALAGFFYAGYADCVRCFQCGLGLRSWKPGDDVYSQHEKHRPNCPFLQTQKMTRIDEASSNDLNTKVPEENIAVRLLKLENTKLEEQLKCKVCYKSQIKDLFLPCGELYACSDCSKLLTHCPSCNKQILATVATFFT
ncbi:unnamed protein product [Lymnaea stagnalis]|uniref:RING-type domain-containing protein n=1 Tax=Lymnaea stagnalis TaxID=6523 RepID=A0AAV2IND2_LYMST